MPVYITVASAATRLARRLLSPVVIDFNSECKRRDRRKVGCKLLLAGVALFHSVCALLIDESCEIFFGEEISFC
jgi:hypothetical protein